MLRLKLWQQASRGRRLNVKRIILFLLIVYAVYLLIDNFLALFMIGFVIWLLCYWTGIRRL